MDLGPDLGQNSTLYKVSLPRLFVLPMADLVRLTDYRTPANGVFFDRTELRKLLQVYSTRVARGEWRDYAIDHRRDMAAFAVFRSSYDWPLYVFTKTRGRGRRAERWTVLAGPRRLIQGRTIDDVLSQFTEEIPEPA